MPASDGRPLRRRVPRQGTRTCPVRVKRPQTAIDAASGAPISARDRVKLFLANAQYRGLILNQTLMRAFLRLAARRSDEIKTHSGRTANACCYRPSICRPINCNSVLVDRSGVPCLSKLASPAGSPRPHASHVRGGNSRSHYGMSFPFRTAAFSIS